MKLYEKEVFIPLVNDNKNLLQYLSKSFSDKIDANEIPIRFAITKTDDKGYDCELGVLSGANKPINSIFDFKKRTYEKTKKFTAVLVIPTGIDAILGGHAGDAGALARLISSACDTLITHPNVVNASDINELPENGLYVEGSILSRLLMGTIGLQRVRANRLLVVIDEHDDEFLTNCAINAVSAARACLGLNCVEVVRLGNKFKMKSKYTKSGRAVGIIENLEGLYDILKSREGKYDAVAISSVVESEDEIWKDYFKGKIANPFGGVEAILTHSISSLLNLPSAHAPMEEDRELLEEEAGIVDPRLSAEVVSTTFFHCVLKGLHKSPRIISDPEIINKHGVINASDISCLIIPDGCIGLPVLAALEQGIPVIAVKENKNLMKNDLEKLPWAEGQLIIVNTYLEAVGAMHVLKSGVALESVKRPLGYTKVSE